MGLVAETVAVHAANRAATAGWTGLLGPGAGLERQEVAVREQMVLA
jgi:hypothetical protein